MPMKVVISGGGIAANVFLRQLRRLMNSGDLPKINVRAYEKRSKLKASPPGLNVLMNHNGMETLKECDNELFEEIVANGIPCPNWSACSMSGDVMYDMEDVVGDGMTGTVATLARWDVFHNLEWHRRCLLRRCLLGRKSLSRKNLFHPNHLNSLMTRSWFCAETTTTIRTVCDISGND